MKFGIIGFGSIGKRHYDNLQEHKVEIVVLTQRKDVDVNRVSSWEEFAAAGPYDAIFITNETAKHVSTIEQAISLNPKALFIEKPLSHNSKELDRLAKAIVKKKISVWVAYNFQFFTPFIRIKEIIKDGILGRVYSMRVFVGQDLKVWRQRDYRMGYSSKKDLGGGVMLDLVHEINYPAWMLEEELQPKLCLAKKVSDLESDTEDCAESILLTASQAIVSIHQDYLRIPYQRSLDIVGSDASLNWNSDSNTVIVQTKDETILEEKTVEDRNLMYERELDFFISGLKDDIHFSNLKEAIKDVKNIEFLKSYAGRE